MAYIMEELQLEVKAQLFDQDEGRLAKMIEDD